MSTDRTNTVIEAIDGALQDWSVSGDAMRWSPEPKAEPAAGENLRIVLVANTSAFEEAMLRAVNLLCEIGTTVAAAVGGFAALGRLLKPPTRRPSASAVHAAYRQRARRRRRRG